MAVNKVTYGGETLIDLTGDTVTADTLAEGVTAHDASGAEIVGTMVQQSGVQMATGTFTGNGGTSYTVSGLNFKPTTVYVFAIEIPAEVTATSAYYMLSKGSDGKGTHVYNGRLNNTASRFRVTINSDGFTVATPNNSSFLTNKFIYRYIAYT